MKMEMREKMTVIKTLTNYLEYLKFLNTCKELRDFLDEKILTSNNPTNFYTKMSQLISELCEMSYAEYKQYNQE